MKYLIIGAIVAFACLTTVKAQGQGQSCHLRELDLCAATLVVFTQSPSTATGEADLDKQCVYLKEADVCFKNYTARCMTRQQKELLGFVTDGALKLMDQYCTPGSELRKNYLKNAECLGTTARGSTKQCIQDLQAYFEVVTSVKWDKRIPTLCCAARRTGKCTNAKIEEKCGADAKAFVDKMHKMILGRLPDMVCQNEADSSECNELLPPAGTPPKGGKSNSVLSRLFAAYTGL